MKTVTMIGIAWKGIEQIKLEFSGSKWDLYDDWKFTKDCYGLLKKGRMRKNFHRVKNALDKIAEA